MSKKLQISDAEWRVMEIIWNRNPLTAGEVIESLKNEADWKPQTIKTLLARLVKKGALSHESQQNRYLYSPEISRESAVAAETNSFLDRICQGSLAPMLAHFAESGRALDDEEAEALRRLLEKSAREGQK